jgi:Arc/MetJ family transcription regulator
MYYIICMRTTLDLPENLLLEAIKTSGCKTKTEAIIVALEQLVRTEKLKQLKSWKGKAKLAIDLEALRQR